MIMSTLCFQVDSACNFSFCHLLLSTQMTNTTIGGYGFPGIPEDIYLIVWILSSRLYPNVYSNSNMKKCMFIIMTVKFISLAKIVNYYFTYLSFSHQIDGKLFEGIGFIPFFS